MQSQLLSPGMDVMGSEDEPTDTVWPDYKSDEDTGGSSVGSDKVGEGKPIKLLLRWHL
jgi:hypothetical protein